MGGLVSKRGELASFGIQSDLIMASIPISPIPDLSSDSLLPQTVVLRLTLAGRAKEISGHDAVVAGQVLGGIRFGNTAGHIRLVFLLAHVPHDIVKYLAIKASISATKFAEELRGLSALGEGLNFRSIRILIVRLFLVRLEYLAASGVVRVKLPGWFQSEGGGGLAI